MQDKGFRFTQCEDKTEVFSIAEFIGEFISLLLLHHHYRYYYCEYTVSGEVAMPLMSRCGAQSARIASVASSQVMSKLHNSSGGHRVFMFKGSQVILCKNPTNIRLRRAVRRQTVHGENTAHPEISTACPDVIKCFRSLSCSGTERVSQ